MVRFLLRICVYGGSFYRKVTAQNLFYGGSFYGKVPTQTLFLWWQFLW